MTDETPVTDDGAATVGRPPAGGGTTRRAVLAAGGAGAVGVAATACLPTPPPLARPRPLDPYAVHVARRLSFGPTPSLLADLARLGPDAWVEQQFSAPASWDAALDTRIAEALPWSRGTATELLARGDEWKAGYQLPAATMLRAVCARRHLFEVVVAVLWDHVSVGLQTSGVGYHGPSYDTDVVRAHAFGRYEDLLVASARSGAMMRALNQSTSRADRGRIPNENYARELLELYSVGIGSGYTQTDVLAVAHLLSGWTLTNSAGTYRFTSSWHSPGAFADPTFQVLGWSRGALSGEAAGEAFLRHLANHRLTAVRLAHKFAVRLVGDHITASSALVARAADAYQAAGTQMVPMLRTLVTAPEFRAATGRKVRRPSELAAAMLRGLSDGQFPPGERTAKQWEDNSYQLFGQLDSLGNSPHRWPAPNGYPDPDGAWVGAGSLVGRWNLSTRVAHSSIALWRLDWTSPLQWRPGITAGQWLDTVTRRFGIDLSEADRNTVLFLSGRGAAHVLKVPADTAAMRWMMNYLFQSAEMQLR